jgi:hypothetical protein
VVSGFEDPVLIRDARLHGAHDFLVKPVAIDMLLAKAREALTARDKRRWPRKQLSGSITATIDGRPVRVLDVSYGGMRLEVPFAVSAGAPLEIKIASMATTIPADTVWGTNATAAGVQQCGAAIRASDQLAVAWRHIVDALANPAAEVRQQ